MNTPVHPLDLTGVAESNCVTNEYHLPYESLCHGRRVIAPLAAPFFETSLIVTHWEDTTARVLVLEEDYAMFLPCYAASDAADAPIVGAIVLLNAPTTGILYLTYQTLGGAWTQHQNAVLTAVASHRDSAWLMVWDALLPSPDCVAGLVTDAPACAATSGDTITALVSIADAIAQRASKVPQLAHLIDTENPHQTTLEQLGHRIATDTDLDTATPAFVLLDQCVALLEAVPVDPNTTSPSVVQPSVCAPVPGYIHTTPTVTLNTTTFGVLGGTDTWIGSHWQLSTEENFATLLTSVVVAAPGVTWTTPALTDVTVYYVRVCHQGVLYGYSPWSTPSVIRTGVIAIVATPVITSPVNGTTDQSITQTATVTPLTVLNGIDTGVSSEWMLATDAAFLDIVVNEIRPSVETLSWALPALAYATRYYLRFRYTSAIAGTTPWSETITFFTELADCIAPPTIVSPIALSVETTATPTLQSSVFSMDVGDDTHATTDWELATDATFTTIVQQLTADPDALTAWTVSALVSGTTYYVRVRYTGVTTVSSAWSTPLIFSVVLASFPLFESAKLFATDGAAEDYFGYSVALSGDGQTACVGAYGDDNANGNDAGSAYIFSYTNSTWVQEAKLLSSVSGGWVNAGSVVALSGDGLTACSVNLLQGSGVVTVYTRAGTVWTEQARLVSPETGLPAPCFGVSVSLSHTGDTLCVGSYHESVPGHYSSGVVYIFVRNTTVWTQQAKLTAPDPVDESSFGDYVKLALDGSTVCIGERGQSTVYIFTRSGSEWTQQAALPRPPSIASYSFGEVIAFSGDGQTVLIKAEMYEEKSKVAVFSCVNAVWTHQVNLMASNGTVDDRFGTAIAVSSDGQFAYIGAMRADPFHETVGWDAGAVYLFTKVDNVWSEDRILYPGDFGDASRGDAWFGSALALSDDDSTLCIGAMRANSEALVPTGSAYIFR